MNLLNIKEVSYYILVGVFATAVDWLTFSMAIKWLNFPYQLALLLALTLGGLAHYTSNKAFTYKCRSKKYSSQVPLYILLATINYFCSMGCIGLLVKFLGINQLWARIITTGVMILPNYLLHKYITFNKRIFVQPPAL
ncbi:MAG: GtrA family protein [Gammaproteobacteria bacterium]